MLGILLGTSAALLMVVMRAMKSDLVTNVFREGHHIRKVKLKDYIYDVEGNKKDILLVKLEGELNYLNTETHTGLLAQIQDVETVVLGFGYTCVMDNDAAEELDQAIKVLKEKGIHIYITGLQDQNLELMKHGTMYDVLHESGHIYHSKSVLLEKLLG